MKRFYEINLNKNNAISGQIFELSERNKHYCAHVLRMKVSDKITVFNETCGEFEAVISELSKKKVCVCVCA